MSGETFFCRQRGEHPPTRLCLDSKCSFGKILDAVEAQKAQLCLDSKCSFGKIVTIEG